MNKKSLLLYIFLLAVAFLAVSCPLPSPMEPPHDALPFLIPDPPVNVKATKTQSDRIVITWEPSPSENVSAYQVLYADSASFMTTPEFKKKPPVDGNEFVFTNVAPGSSYVFSVIAIRDVIGQHADILKSLPSEAAEGATLGVPEITGITRQSGIILSWSVENFFSVLPGHDGKSIYGDLYDFVISYRPKGTEILSDVVRTKDLRAVVPPSGTNLNGVKYSLSNEKDYEFFVTMNIYESKEDMEAGNTKIKSRSVPVTTRVPATEGAGRLLELKGVSGKSADGILLSWTCPIVIGQAQDAYYSVFRVERAPAGTNDWQVIVGEKESPEKVETVLQNEEYTFFDTTAEINTNYIYRVTNGWRTDWSDGGYEITLAEEPDVLVDEHTKAPLSLHRTWVPTGAITGSEFILNTDTNLSGEVGISWPVDEILFPEVKDAEWTLEMRKWHSEHSGENAYYDEPVIIEEGVSGGFILSREENRYSLVYTVSIDESEKDHSHLFEFALRYSSPSEKGEPADVRIPVRFTAGNEPMLGSSGIVPLFEDLTASVDRVGEVKLSWKDINISPDADTGRAYEVYVGEKLLTDVEEQAETDGIFTNSITLGVNDIELPPGEERYEFRLVCYEGKKDNESKKTVYINPVAVTGSVLHEPVIKASKGTSDEFIQVDVSMAPESEAAIRNVMESVAYEVEYSPVGKDEWKVLEGSRLMSEADHSTDGVEYEFRARAYNKDQTTGGNNVYTGYSNTDRGAIFGGAGMTVDASVAENAEYIRVGFTRALGAESYSLRRREAGTEEWTDLSVTQDPDNDFFLDKTIAGKKNMQRSSMYEYKVVPNRAGLEASESSMPTSSGCLFMPPETVNASKGIYPGQVLVEWTPALVTHHDGSVTEAANGYAIIAYTEEQKKDWDTYDEKTMVRMVVQAGKDSKAWNDESGTYMAKVSVGADRGLRTWYSVVSINGDGTASKPQNRFDTVRTEVRTEIDSNVGYSKQSDIEDVVVINQFDQSTKMLMDSILVKWKRVDSARIYSIVTDAPAENTTMLDIEDIDWTTLREVGEQGNMRNVYSNAHKGYKPGMPGYFEYEPSEMTYSYYDDTGVLDGTKLHISKYEVLADLDPEGKEYDDTSYGKVDGRFQRQFKPVELVNITNNFLRTQIDQLDGKLDGDWWPEPGAGNKKVELGNGTSAYVESGGLSFNHEKNYIELDSVKDTLFSQWIFSNTDADGSKDVFRLEARTYTGGSLGQDHLQHIGHGGKGTLYVTGTGAWWPFSVNYSAIRGAHTGSGSYTVTIDRNGKTESFTIRDSEDPMVLQRPYTWKVTDL